MKWVTHYYNEKTKKLACNQRVGMSFRGNGSARSWTTDKEIVTCSRCLAQLAKWAAYNEKHADTK